MADEREKQALLAEIEGKIELLLKTDTLSEDEKASTLRKALAMAAGDKETARMDTE